MVCEFGMSEKLGLIEYGEHQGEVYIARDLGTRSRNYSESTAELIDSEVRFLVDSAYERAMAILTENRDKLDILTEALMEFETLEGSQVMDILEYGEMKNPPSRVTPPPMPSEVEEQPGKDDSGHTEKKEAEETRADGAEERKMEGELEQAERELAQKREEAKSRKKLSGIAPQKGNISELQAQMNLIRQKTAAAKEKIKAVDAALETLEEKSGKQERLMQKAEEKLTEQKNKVLADDDRDESAVPEPGDEDLLAVAEYRELSGDVRKTLEQARKKEEQASRAYDEARAAMRKASREEVKKLAKKEKDHASFQKLFTGAASVAGFILLLFTGAAFRSSNS